MSHPVYENPTFNMRESDPIARGEPVFKPFINECSTFFRYGGGGIGPRFYGLFVFVSALYLLDFFYNIDLMTRLCF